MFDVGLRTDGRSHPFVRQLPVFNWYYPFDRETARFPGFLDALEDIDWSRARRRAVYFHIPFCDTICTFCPFMRGVYTTDQVVEDYIRALVREVQLKRPYLGKLKIDSVFVGGGTPSVLTCSQIRELGDCIHTYFDTSSLLEFAVEAEVKSVTREKLIAFKEAGVTRISFGVQTFSQSHREAFQLDAGISQIWRATGWANELFSYTNVDMIYGIAGQQTSDVIADADAAIELATTTIDFYPLNNLAAQAKMHRALKDRGFQRPTAGQRSEQRRRLAEHMISRGYARINGFSYAVRTGSSEELLQPSPNFLYHDILYGQHDDAVVGYGASALSMVPGYNLCNVDGRQEYTYLALNRDTLPSVAYRIGECPEKGIVTFPYRGVLAKSGIPWGSVPQQTLEALDQLIRAGLVSEHADTFKVTETGWLFYVNLMYFLMPDEGKLWLSDRIAAGMAAGECESTNLACGEAISGVNMPAVRLQ